MRKYILAILLVLNSSLTFASGTISTNIKSLWVNDGANEVVYLEPENRFTSVCDTQLGSKYFIIHLDRPNMKEAYSMALAAFMSGTEVNVGGVNQCYSGNEVLKYIYLKK